MMRMCIKCNPYLKDTLFRKRLYSLYLEPLHAANPLAWHGCAGGCRWEPEPPSSAPFALWPTRAGPGPWGRGAAGMRGWGPGGLRAGAAGLQGGGAGSCGSRDAVLAYRCLKVLMERGKKKKVWMHLNFKFGNGFLFSLSACRCEGWLKPASPCKRV